MPRSRRFRLSALLAGLAVAAGSLLTALPAAADDDPTPAEPTFQQVPEQPSGPGADFAGTFAGIADEVTGEESTALHLFQVSGYGFLAADTTDIAPADLLSSSVVTFAVPDGMTLTGDARTRFQRLADASVRTPLTIISIRSASATGRQNASLVNQTPNAPAVHRIYAVLVSPSNKSRSSTQTSGRVRTAVAHADDYWNQQSGGSIRFSLAGTTKWYKTGSSCASQQGSLSLWNKAAKIAKSQLGYAAGKNDHLVLFLPRTADCGGSIGLGSVGLSANVGGLAWVIGSSALLSQGALAHELGHNLSLGHADRLSCTSAAPVGGFVGFDTGPGGPTGCLKIDYGDLLDVMGIGQDERDGGALSAPQAIRAGIWADDAWTTAQPTGVAEPYELNAVSSNTGLRAVVVQDDDGVNYFVEYRDFSDEDAQYGGPDPLPGIRVLRLENSLIGSSLFPNGTLGYRGDDSLLVARTVAGQPVSRYQEGESFLSKGTSGIKVEVIDLDGPLARVEITKSPDTATPGGAFRIVRTSGYDSRIRVGDTWTAFAGGKHDAQNTTFQWYRVREVMEPMPHDEVVLIPGATKQNYTLTAADLGFDIAVQMSGSSPAGGTTTDLSYREGPIEPGVYLRDDPGSVTVSAVAPLHATDDDWPAGTTFTYNWYRGSSSSKVTTRISGAHAIDFTPPQDYAGKYLRVKVTASIPGYTNQVSRYSPAIRYTLATFSPVSPALVNGPAAPDLTLTVHPTTGDVSPAASGYSVRWYRGSSKISGATGASYRLTSADAGKLVTARVTYRRPGYADFPLFSSPDTGTANYSVVTATPPAYTGVPKVGETLSAVTGRSYDDGHTLASGIGVTETFRWLRNGRSISGATGPQYTLRSRDYGETISVRITAAAPGLLANVSTTSATQKIRTEVFPGWDQTPVVSVSGGVASFAPVITTSGTSKSYRWYRDGVRISKATKSTYTLTAADAGTALQVRIAYRKSGYTTAIVVSSGYSVAP